MNTPIWSLSDYQKASTMMHIHTQAEVGAAFGGISASAVANRLYRWRRMTAIREREYTAYTPHQIARVLGCPYNSVRVWRITGRLSASVRISSRRILSSADDIRAFLAAGHALCPSICPPPTALYWRGQVEQERIRLRHQWIEQRVLADALAIGSTALYECRRRGFPRPVFDIGIYGVWLDRQAVIAWLNQWPRRWTKAARRLLEGVH